MEVDRELLIEWGVPILATLVFIVVVGLVGQRYNADGLSETGALVLVGVIVAFVLGMALVGIIMAGDDDDGTTDENDASGADENA